ncbi:hypothetical protein OHA25_38540 [Nonomuraea sp. NBC_00507]|uniref:hypothetical protein n=1 Tax=Nonomuraea sp. NBC_00507 TaxID=2976002 RepID=UPI002E17EB4E
MTAPNRKITALHGDDVNLADAADRFLSTNRMANPNTHRAYASAIDRIVAELGGGTRHLAAVSDEEIGEALLALWGGCAPAMWNRNRAAVSTWLTWCATKKRWAAPSVPADAERRREHLDQTKAVTKTTIQRLLSRRDLPLREKACGGCCMRPPPAPARSSPWTWRTWTWKAGALPFAPRAATPNGSTGTPAPPASYPGYCACLTATPTAPPAPADRCSCPPPQN